MCFNKDIKTYSLLALILSLISVNGFAASLDITDPTGLKSTVNSLGTVLQDQIGNYTMAELNANQSRLVFPFDNAYGYSSLVSPNQLNRIILTKTVSGIDLVVTFQLTSGSGYGRIRTADNSTPPPPDGIAARATSSTTSDAYALVYKYAADVATITFSKPLNGVCFTLTRLAADANVVLYDSISGGNQIATYRVPANNTAGKPHSFFGYNNPAEAKIARIVINTPGLNPTGFQYYLDDLAVILPMCSDTAMAGDINKDCYVNFADLNAMLLNWLSVQN